MLVGAAGTFKSFLALHWALQAAKEGKTVVYLINEATSLVYPRLRAWADHHGSEVPEGVSFFISPFHLAGDHQRIAQMVGPADLIIVDTLRRATPGLAEDSSDDFAKVVASTDFISRQTGAAILLIDHTGWENQSRERGSSSKRDAADMTMSLERTRGSISVTLRCLKLKHTQEWQSEQWQLLETKKGPVLVPSATVPFAQQSFQKSEQRDVLLKAFGAEEFDKLQAAKAWGCSWREANKRLVDAKGSWVEVATAGAGNKPTMWRLRGDS
jgi:hypothetical protein